MGKHDIKTILVTGGAGFIGSHTSVELLQQGIDVIVVDDLSNAHEKVIARIKKILSLYENEAYQVKPGEIFFYKADVKDEAALRSIFSRHAIDAVIHFAGFKAVGESMEKPLDYYENNLESSIHLLKVMREYGCKKLVFSSSATVYGNPETAEFVETMPKGAPENVYGWTKWMIEQICSDAVVSEPGWSVVLLRYFNPVGAHKSGLIGEDPEGIPNNLMPYVAQVAVGKLEKLHVFGNDYNTPDGTGRRDFIHVVDLARGHVAALDWIKNNVGLEVINLGRGVSSSVLEVVQAFEVASGTKIPYVIDPRRPGDIDEFYANPQKAWEILGWRAEYTLDDMCKDMWNWQTKNPQGYATNLAGIDES